MKICKLFFCFVVCFIALFVFSENANAQAIQEAQNSLAHTFLDGLRWGFISVLQPCLNAMIPLTVKIFLKRYQSIAK